jgi:hypothetical protein
MAYKDYLPGGEKAGGLDTEIADSQNQSQAREHDPNTGQFVATPETVDWEQRYKDLEVHNSKQAQNLGLYKNMVDEYITNPTPATPVVEEAVPITVDDLYDNPDETIQRAVESHPAIREARELKEDMRKRDMEESLKGFEVRHPDYTTLATDPKFRNWVDEEPMRVELYGRANGYDLSAADALFSLYKAENNITQMNNEQLQAQQINAVSLEDSSSVMVTEPSKYSRTEYIDWYRRARQGDMEADRWVQRNAAAYREALGNGNVRD